MFTTKAKTLLLLCHFHRSSAKFLVRQFYIQGKGFYLTLKCFLMNIFSQTQISGTSSCEWSILAVSVAKFGLLREPIRMLRLTMDQFSYMIKGTYKLDMQNMYLYAEICITVVENFHRILTGSYRVLP